MPCHQLPLPLEGCSVLRQQAHSTKQLRNRDLDCSARQVIYRPLQRSKRTKTCLEAWWDRPQSRCVAVQPHQLLLLFCCLCYCITSCLFCCRSCCCIPSCFFFCCICCYLTSVSLSAAFAALHVSLSAAQGSLSPEMQHEYLRHAAEQLREQATYELVLELAFYTSIVTVSIVIPSELH